MRQKAKNPPLGGFSGAKSQRSLSRCFYYSSPQGGHTVSSGVRVHFSDLTALGIKV